MTTISAGICGMCCSLGVNGRTVVFCSEGGSDLFDEV